MTSLATRQKAVKFNNKLNFDTSSVTSMKDMFRVRVPSTRPSRAASLRAACITTAFSSPGQHLALLRMTSLATRQGAKKFNKKLSFTDTSKVTSMQGMFSVRVPPTRPLAERLPCVRLPCVRLAPPPRPPPSHLQAHTSPRLV